LQHELWLEPDGSQTFCLKGVHGNAARSLLAPGAELVWEVDATSYYEAMTLYYKYMDWGHYMTSCPDQDCKTYSELGWE
jgi:hypothetical protein